MNLKIPITPSHYVDLDEPVHIQFNDWRYRTQDLHLSLKHLEISAQDFPVFWQEFLTTKKSLKWELRSRVLDVLREVEIDEFGVTLTKVMKVLDQDS